eukprot:tig00000073_g1698.t1
MAQPAAGRNARTSPASPHTLSSPRPASPRFSPRASMDEDDQPCIPAVSEELIPYPVAPYRQKMTRLLAGMAAYYERMMSPQRTQQSLLNPEYNNKHHEGYHESEAVAAESEEAVPLWPEEEDQDEPERAAKPVEGPGSRKAGKSGSPQAKFERPGGVRMRTSSGWWKNNNNANRRALTPELAADGPSAGAGAADPVAPIDFSPAEEDEDDVPADDETRIAYPQPGGEGEVLAHLLTGIALYQRRVEAGQDILHQPLSGAPVNLESLEPRRAGRPYRLAVLHARLPAAAAAELGALNGRPSASSRSPALLLDLAGALRAHAATASVQRRSLGLSDTVRPAEGARTCSPDAAALQALRAIAATERLRCALEAAEAGAGAGEAGHEPACEVTVLLCVPAADAAGRELAEGEATPEAAAAALEEAVLARGAYAVAALRPAASPRLVWRSALIQ